MIVRKRKDMFVCIRQQDHAFIAGEFATHFPNETIKPLSSTLFAIYHHDDGWIDLDHTLSWNTAKNRPYTFDDYPLTPKIKAYQKGISAVESVSPYAGYLCSYHFTSFFKQTHNAQEIQFVQEEEARQHKIIRSMSPEEKSHVDQNIRFLKFCDDLSLALCLNEPMENTHPWFIHGISYNEEQYHWIWKDEKTLSLSPHVFLSPLQIHIPYTLINTHQEITEEGMDTFFITA